MLPDRADAADFASAPVGRCITGPTYVYGFLDSSLSVVLLWGHPSRADFERLLPAYGTVLRSGAPHDSLVDASGLTDATVAGFDRVATILRSRVGVLEGQIRRQAMVLPTGTLGAFLAAFYAMLRPAYPTAVFEDRRAALAWLGYPAALDALAALESRERGDPVVLELRRLLADRGHAPSLERAASALGMAPRKLQRRLRDGGTSFRDELARYRIHRAQVLLSDPETKLSAIAAELGLSTAQNFSTFFRRVTGVSPSEWRQARRPPVVISNVDCRDSKQ
jgi:AraC-like DNA-binding protein